MTNYVSQRHSAPTQRAYRFHLRANFSGQPLETSGRTSAEVVQKQGTTHRYPLNHTNVSRHLGTSGPSIVEACGGSTLQEWWVVPNPQHLLLTLFFETSMHEEKCPL
jgi:hypothetical protein